MTPWQWLRRPVRRDGRVRVLFVVPDLGVGGAERHVATLAPALDSRRFAPAVVCIGDEGALFDGLAAAGVPALALHARRNPLAALAGLVRVIRRGRPDVVITRGYNAEALGRLAAVLTRAPRSVMWVHNCGDITPRGRLRPWVDRALDPITDAYYAVAHGQRPYLTGELGYPDEKIVVVHNGVDPGRFESGRGAAADRGDGAAALAAELGLDPAAPVIGIVAVLRPEKDHATLLRAFAIVRDQVPAAQLLVVGDGPERARLEKLAAELGVADGVVFAGSRPDVGRLFGIIDVAVLSSWTVECFPMALLEAMASGVPTVGTAVGGVPEMIEEGVTGHVVPPRAPRALAAPLVAMLSEPQRTATMGRAARDRVRREFTLERSVRAAESAILRTVGRDGDGEPPPRPVALTVVLDRTFVGGAESVLLGTLAHLDRDRITPRLICLREGGPLASRFEAAGVPVEVLHRRGRWDPSTLPRLVRRLRATGTDVVLVHHHNRAALTLGRLAARLAGVRANVVAAHDMDLDRVHGRVLPRHDVATLFLSDALVLLAPSQGRYLHEREGVGRFPWRRVREVVIPNGIEIGPVPGPAERAAARAGLGLATDEVVFGVVARLSPQKAHHLLLGAFADIAAQRRVRLVVVGDGERAAELRTLAARLGVADLVLFTGIRSDVPELLPAFDVSCLSSVHEGAPLSVLEAMAAGVPVLSTDVGALRDLVHDGREGYLVPAGDRAALGARMAELADDAGLRTRMGAMARTRAERDYSIERTAAGYTRLVSELVTG